MKVGKELLRYEPPVQLLQSRTALTDVDVAGVTGRSPISAALASKLGGPDRPGYATTL